MSIRFTYVYVLDQSRLIENHIKKGMSISVLVIKI